MLRDEQTFNVPEERIGRATSDMVTYSLPFNIFPAFSPDRKQFWNNF